MEESMLAKNWKRWIAVSKSVLIVRGILFLLLGVLMFKNPGWTMTAITISVGVLILLESLAQFIGGLGAAGGTAKTVVLVEAVLLFLLGLFTVSSPFWMALTWVIMVGIWELLTGFQLLFFRDPAGRTRAGAIVSGVLSVLIGLAFLGSPLIGLITLTWLLTVLFFVSGLTMLVAGLTLK